MSELQASLNGLGHMVALSKSLKHAEAVLKGLETAEQSHREITEATDKARTELATLQASIASAEATIEQLPDHGATLERLQREIVTAERQLDDLRSEATRIRIENAEAQRQLDGKRALAAEIAGKLGSLANTD